MAGFIFRLIMLCLIGWVGWKIYQAFNKQSAAKSSTKADSAEQSAPEAIRPCAHCGVHCSETRSIQHDDKFYCSKEHLEQHLKE